MTEIKIAYALDDEDNLIGIAEAERGQKVFCPLCKNPVIVRKGNIRIHHFAHKVSDICTQETVTHKVAKLLIQKTIEDWKKGKTQAPVVMRNCKSCRHDEAQPLPNKVEKAELELPLKNGFIVDVALISDQKPVAAIEVRVTHAVDAFKDRTLNIPYIEVDGEEVINNPKRLEPINDRFNQYICTQCKKALQKFQYRANKVAEEIKIKLPDTYYRYGISQCWKCKRKIIVYTWPGHDEFNGEKPNGIPIPATVVYRYSKTVNRSYWVNVCPFCDATQGDFFIYRRYLSPFYGLDCGFDNEDDFYMDMLFIAKHDSDRFNNRRWMPRFSIEQKDL